MKNKNKHKLKNTLQKIMAITMAVTILSTLLLLPANASEETEETCIISGTWRFNDVLTMAGLTDENFGVFLPLSYSVTGYLDGVEVTQEFVFIAFGKWYDDRSQNRLLYVSDVDLDNSNYLPAWAELVGWEYSVGLVGEGAKTIMISTEQEVSKEFYTWLTKNAKRIDAEVKPSSYTSTIIQGASGILGGIGKGAVNFFESIFIDDKGGISTLGIYCLCFVGIGMAIGIMRWIRKKCG